jgi:hypothetical protein
VHWDEQAQRYEPEVAFPAVCDPQARSWIPTKVTWEQTFAQWKQGAPGHRERIERIQREEWGEKLWKA